MMQMTKSQLKETIRNIVKAELKENFGIAGYQRMLDIKEIYGDDLYVLNKVGPDLYQKILDFETQAKDYPEFKSMVDGMPENLAKKFWNREMGNVRNASALMMIKKELDELQQRFKEVDGTSEADEMYGRKTKKIIDTKTGEVVGTITDKTGSLGT